MGTELKGKTAVVTGASSGIGKAIAERLGAGGAHVFLSGRTAEPMTESKQRIEAHGGAATIVTADVRDAGSVQALVDQAVAATGRLDIMVNNAGLAHLGSIAAGSIDEWREMLEVNILALLEGCSAAVRAMRECGAEGHIVNISSNAARRPDSGVYGATKHAVNVIGNSLRNELEGDTIRVVTIMPGAIATNFSRNMNPAITARMLKDAGIVAEVKAGEHMPQDVIDKLQAATRQYFASADDVANAVWYAVTQPIDVHVQEIVVRPPKMVAL